MKPLEAVSAKVDTWQRAHRVASVMYAVTKKFGDDSLNQFVVGLGWYGFVAIYPLLLVIITIFGFVGQASLGHGIVATLHQFPVVGSQFNPAHSNRLHGSIVGLVIGLVGLVYGAQGVMQTAQQALSQAWNVPRIDAPGFVPRLVRSLVGLVIIGLSFLVSAVLATLAEASTTGLGLQILILVCLVVLNALLYLAAFRALTPRTVATRPLIPGAFVGSIGFTLLITVGSGLIQHQVRNSSATYGQFGIVIGLVGFLFLVAKISLYGVELNPVLHRHLWPRGIRNDDPTPADDEVLADVVHEQRRRSDQVVAVGFGQHPATAAVEDARAQDVRSQSINGRLRPTPLGHSPSHTHTTRSAVSPHENTDVLPPSPEGADHSTRELLSLAAEQISHLIQDELRYAQKEVQAKAKRSAAGVAMFAAATIVTFLALGALVTAAIIALAQVVTAWLAAIIVAGGLLVLAVVVVLAGKHEISAGTPPLPTEALASTKEDVHMTKEAVKI